MTKERKLKEARKKHQSKTQKTHFRLSACVSEQHNRKEGKPKEARKKHQSKRSQAAAYCEL
jgi:hypothetical protein